MRQIIIAGILFLAGCAPTLKGGGEAGGIITNAARKGQSFQIAQDHCSKYGKAARVSTQDNWEGVLTFDCVAK